MDNKQSYTYQRYIANKNRYIYIGLFSSLGLLALWWLIFKIDNWYFATALMFGLAFLIKYVDKKLRHVERRNYLTWGRGAGAELKEGYSLERLGADYVQIPDIPTGRGNIDNICVGPTGVFVLEVKASTGILSYTDRLLINGQEPEKDYIRQLWAEVNFVRSLLHQKLGREFFVEGVLQFPNARADSSIKGKKHGIWIGGRSFANYVIRHKGAPLDQSAIQAIVGVMRAQKELTEPIKSIELRN